MKKLMLFYILTIVLSFSGPAQATILGTVDIKYAGHGASGLLKVWGGGHSGALVRGGVYMLEKTGGTDEGELWLDGTIGGFCIDLPEPVSMSTLKYDVVMPQDSPVPTSFLSGYMGTEKAEYLRELWGRFFDPAWAGSGPFTWRQKNNAKAFSAAVWEIVYEQIPDSPDMWDVRVDGTEGDLGFRSRWVDRNTANNWLHTLDGNGPKAQLRSFVHDGKQDYVVSVPEPTTIALLGFGILSFAGRKRHRHLLIRDSSNVANQRVSGRKEVYMKEAVT